MKKLLIALLLCLSITPLAAEEDKVLLTIDDQPVYLSEFLYIYQKNSKEANTEPKSMAEYLDLFINFKLKVKEAQDRGFDTTIAFIKELEGYRAQATPKYLTDSVALEKIIACSYQWSLTDRRVAHIAIECPANADSAKVAQAQNAIANARARVINGESFESVARDVSTDPGIGENGGELGWIQPFRFVYPFEKAVYTTPVGEVTPVFRSPYGFHIALVEEERAHEEVQAAHIMKMTPRGDSLAAERAKQQIDSLYTLLQDPNVDFATLARENSDDKGSAIRGGDLGWFGHGAMVQPFEDAVFALTEVGQRTKPFLSRFGWHIAELRGRRGTLPYEEIHDQLEKRVKRDERFKEVQEAFIANTRAEYNLPDTMSDDNVMAFADAHLEEKYPEFRQLVKEYHDGILLFDVSLEEVWDKAAKDTIGLTRFFAENQSNYSWDEPRFKGVVVFCKDKQTLKAAKSIIKQANTDSVPAFLSRLNTDSVKYVRYEKGLWLKGRNAAVDKFGFKDKKATFKTDEKFPFVLVEGRIINAPEVYTDDRSKVTADYQEYLDAQWIKELRSKHNLVVYPNVLPAE